MTLVRQRRSLKAGNKLARKVIKDFQCYLYREKFHKETHIQTWEVHERLRLIESYLIAAEARCLNV